MGAGLPQAEASVDLPSGRPPKELPQVIAAMGNVDDAGFTLPLFSDLPVRHHQRRAPGANGENPDVNYSECKVRGETLRFERRHVRLLTLSGPELPNFHGGALHFRRGAPQLEG